MIHFHVNYIWFVMLNIEKYINIVGILAGVRLSSCRGWGATWTLSLCKLKLSSFSSSKPKSYYFTTQRDFAVQRGDSSAAITSRSFSFKAWKDRPLCIASIALRSLLRGVCRGVFSTICYGLLKAKYVYGCLLICTGNTYNNVIYQSSTRTRKIYN